VSPNVHDSADVCWLALALQATPTAMSAPVSSLLCMARVLRCTGWGHCSLQYVVPFPAGIK
jgi:hypothetical protein